MGDPTLCISLKISQTAHKAKAEQETGKGREIDHVYQDLLDPCILFSEELQAVAEDHRQGQKSLHNVDFLISFLSYHRRHQPFTAPWVIPATIWRSKIM